MRAILSWTIWQRRWSWLFWALGICAFIILSLSFYASFRGQAAQLNEVLSNLPQAARSLFTDNADFLSPEGFLSARLYYLLLPLLLSVLSIGLGGSLISKEEESGTLDLLLARPISRTKLLIAKAASGFIIVGGVALAALVTTLIVSRLVDINVAISHIIVATFYSALLALVFGALAFCISTIGRGARLASVGVASLFGLGSYIISSLAGTVHWFVWPAKFLPYNYYRPGQILAGEYSWQNAVVLIVIFIGLGIVSWAGFRGRDIGV